MPYPWGPETKGKTVTKRADPDFYFGTRIEM